MTRVNVTAAATGGALLFLAASIRAGADGTQLARLLIVGVALGAVAATDLAEHRIPNRIVLPASVVCGATLVADAARLHDMLDGLGLVALMLAFSLARPRSFGMGDVKLGLLVVLGLGGLAAQALLLGLALAAFFGVVLILRDGRLATTRSIPLAPFMSGAAAVVALL